MGVVFRSDGLPKILPKPEWKQLIHKVKIEAGMKKERKRRVRSKNVGHTDSILRVAAGSVLLIGGVIFESWWALAGLVLIITGGLAWCPFYHILGIKTCNLDAELEV